MSEAAKREGDLDDYHPLCAGGPSVLKGLEAHEDLGEELITYIALAAAQGRQWKDKLVAYVGDNTNVVGWLNTRRSP